MWGAALVRLRVGRRGGNANADDVGVYRTRFSLRLRRSQARRSSIRETAGTRTSQHQQSQPPAAPRPGAGAAARGAVVFK